MIKRKLRLDEWSEDRKKAYNEINNQKKLFEYKIKKFI